MKLNIYIIIAAMLIAFIGCKEEVKEKKEVLRPVNFQVVGSSEGAQIRTFSGVAKAGDEIELSFRATGIITKLNAKVGQKVKKGDLIAKLDNVQANLAYEQSLSALNSSESSMNTAKSSLNRIKSLYEKGSNSLSDLEAAKNAFQNALDQYESAKRNKSIQQTQISYGYIYAPSDGLIASSNSDLNENASTGQVIAVLNAGKQKNIVVGLPENVINKVVLGMHTELSFSSIPNEQIKGTVIEISPVLDANSSTYPVKIVIEETTELVKPGMTASVTFNFGESGIEQDKRIIIPVKAVGEDGKGNFVFIINADADNKTGIVKKQQITIGELTNEGFIVEKGLEQGQLVATAGLQTLLDGQKVKLQ